MATLLPQNNVSLSAISNSYGLTPPYSISKLNNQLYFDSSDRLSRVITSNGSTPRTTNLGTLQGRVTYLTRWMLVPNYSNITAVASSANGKILVATVYYGRILRSTNYGMNWSVLYNSVIGIYSCIACSADGNIIFAGNSVGVYRSLNSGTDWNIIKYFSNTISIACSSSGNNLIICNSDSPALIICSTNATEYGSVFFSSPSFSMDIGITKTRVAITANGITAFITNNYNKLYIYNINNNSYILKGISTSDSNSTTSIAISPNGTNIIVCHEINGYIYISNNSGDTWRKANTPARNWSGVALSADGTELVACAIDNYIYRSKDSGITWSTNTISANWTGVASSTDGTRLAACSYNGIYTYTDYVITWAKLSNFAPTNTYNIASSADGTKLVALNDRIYTSINSGLNWTMRATDMLRPWKSVASSADGTKLVACVNDGTLGFIHTSTDSGVSWMMTYDTQARYWNRVASSTDGTKLVACEYGGYIWTSIDSGVTWSTNNNSSGYKAWNGVASSADGTKLVGFLYGEYIYTSADSGFSWIPRITGNWIDVTSSSDGTRLAAANYNGYIWTSTDSGVTWSTNNNSSGVGTWGYMASSADGMILTVGNQSDSNYILRSTNSGLTWSNNNNSSGQYKWESGVACSSDGMKVIAGTNGNGLFALQFSIVTSGYNWTPNNISIYCTSIASSADGTKLAACDYGGRYMWTSTDSGLNWSKYSQSQGFYDVASSADGTKLIACEGGGNIWISTNSGISWTKNTTVNNGSAGSWHRVASSADGKTLCACELPGNIWISTNYGDTWSFRYIAGAGWNDIACSADGTKIIACGQSFVGFHRSSDSGSSWTTNGPYLSWTSVASSADGTKLVACVTAGYIYTSTDSGASWSTNGNSSGSKNWLMVASSADGTKLVACEDNSGYISTSTDSGITWSTNGNSSGSKAWYSVACSANANKLFAGTINGNIYTSIPS